MARPKTKKSQEAKLWRLVSEYVRKRDSIDGWGSCFTCGTTKRWQEFDAGHFVPKTSRSIKYDERNIHSQCARCNRYMSGNIHNYFVNMERLYGREVVDTLLEEKGKTKKYSEVEIDELICYYKDKINNLEGDYEI